MLTGTQPPKHALLHIRPHLCRLRPAAAPRTRGAHARWPAAPVSARSDRAHPARLARRKGRWGPGWNACAAPAAARTRCGLQRAGLVGSRSEEWKGSIPDLLSRAIHIQPGCGAFKARCTCTGCSKSTTGSCWPAHLLLPQSAAAGAGCSRGSRGWRPRPAGAPLPRLHGIEGGIGRGHWWGGRCSFRRGTVPLILTKDTHKGCNPQKPAGTTWV